MSILLVDSYDSFTYNLRDLIHRATKAHVITIHNDSYNLSNENEQSELNRLIDSVDAVVIGPGPGSPSNPNDIGCIPHIYRSYPEKPILGICLGFQILCLINNCEVDYLSKPIHGQVHSINVVDHSSLFKGLPDFIDCVRYHSIYVKEKGLSSTIKPLAYYSGDESNPDRVLMAAQHIESPHYGVQYHPESICSSLGFEMVQNFWNTVNRKSKLDDSLSHDKHLITSKPLIEKFNPEVEFSYQFQQLDNLNNVDNDKILRLCDILQSSDQDVLILNSASAPGEWSLVGLPISNESTVITHSTEDPKRILLSKWNSTENSTVETEDVFQFLANFMSKRYFNPVIPHEVLKMCPFIGGLIGYMSYEEGYFVDIDDLEKRTKSNIDDTKLCFIERFIAIDPEKNAYVVSIRPIDELFLKKINTIFASDFLIDQQDESKITLNKLKDSKITLPEKDTYFKAFDECQKYLHSGDSYELCLTYNTIVQIPQKVSPWEIYKALVKKNPSPYSAYMNFKSSMLLSTSPERFISWTPKFCQMRPIKGTLKKQPNIDYEKACELLKIPKELGENLMIVDLIRDNLLYLLDKIEVTKLMSVEEYETIYQLVSVIEGTFENEFKGVDVLKNSLPPGSMTGAPKKRSVEILQQLENRERRGLYSGICGYWSVNDNADWSVIIRSLFRYQDDLVNDEGFDTYRCGAGGALTVLSTAEGEWDEMLVKLHSVLQLFENVSCI